MPRWSGRWSVVVALGLAVGGCASAGSSSAPPRVSEPPPTLQSPPPAPQAERPLTPEESARLADFQRAADRVRVAYGRACARRLCTPRFVIVEQLPAVGIWDASLFRIRLQRRALAPDVEPRPAVAHELGHWLLDHRGETCVARMFECETAANAEGVRILVVGWGLGEQEAVSLMYNSLMGGLRRGRTLPGHETACREVAVFAQQFNRAPPSC